MMAFDEYIDKVREGKPILFNGRTFNQLKVRQLGVYHLARQSFELMQSSLPPKFARYSWCECLDALDVDAKAEGKQTMFLPIALMVMALAMGLETVRVEGKETYPISDLRNKDGNIVAVAIMDGDSPTLFSMQDMNEIRKIIAVQNLYEVPDESWNPELVRARKYTASLAQSDIDVNIDDLIYSVAVNAHVNPSEIWNWPIRDFKMIQDAIDRTINYQVFQTAEHSGFVKFKRGNPYPTWKYNRKLEIPAEFKTISELDAGAHGLLGVTTKQSE